MNAWKVTRVALSTIALVAGIGGGVAHGPAHAAPAKTLVAVAMRPKFGAILTNTRGFALYSWGQEKNGTVRCTGSCARIWPPVLVPVGVKPATHIGGVMGVFGEVTRPDGSRQLTFDKHPLYTFVSDKTPSQILCDGVNGWHVIRLGSH